MATRRPLPSTAAGRELKADFGPGFARAWDEQRLAVFVLAKLGDDRLRLWSNHEIGECFAAGSVDGHIRELPQGSQHHVIDVQQHRIALDHDP